MAHETFNCPLCKEKLKRGNLGTRIILECRNPNCPLIYMRPKVLKSIKPYLTLPEDLVRVDAVLYKKYLEEKRLCCSKSG